MSTYTDAGRAAARRTGRPRLRATAVGVAALAVTAGVFTAPAQAAPAPDAPTRPATQRAMDAIVAAGIPGVTAQARDRHGAWNGASGIGDRRTGKPRGTHDHFRIASITKTFVATVMLQLAAEGRLDLDDSVDKHLPGLVRGNGHDGRKITVRQLLNHTSGVYDFLEDPAYRQKYLMEKGFLKHRYDYRPPQIAIDTALAHAPYFQPGAEYRYSNTNYILAALVMEKVTGNRYEDEVHRRIVKPLKLRGTSAPGNSSAMPKRSSRAYSTLTEDGSGTIRDVTLQNASQSWAEGDMISTSDDLNRFYRALLRGKLLPDKQLKEMKALTPQSDDGTSGYGLGLGKETTSCGTEIWGHTGGWIGSMSASFTTEDGRRQLTFNLNGDWSGQGFKELLDSGFCGTGAAAKGRKAA
ncbi:serine hydrolase domain-containing protein [Streptomyces yaizuensis]|uniref:D-alanyl-D-alanine carboxypeptidase n=1 Tax=Streptomyces yaizuensis TaxID=2989713 RepID=A0ABQ5PB08_9ACTN|nr:serine hydrolase domain-containing protein [Streptomyces sp. YSPA8]GLF99778.1 D-alanyl-D-alanine carboxypeptidase [Streptomyces sp. YSPA8]